MAAMHPAALATLRHPLWRAGHAEAAEEFAEARRNFVAGEPGGLRAFQV